MLAAVKRLVLGCCLALALIVAWVSAVVILVGLVGIPTILAAVIAAYLGVWVFIGAFIHIRTLPHCRGGYI